MSNRLLTGIVVLLLLAVAAGCGTGDRVLVIELFDLEAGGLTVDNGPEPFDAVVVAEAGYAGQPLAVIAETDIEAWTTGLYGGALTGEKASEIASLDVPQMAFRLSLDDEETWGFVKQYPTQFVAGKPVLEFPGGLSGDYGIFSLTAGGSSLEEDARRAWSG